MPRCSLRAESAHTSDDTGPGLCSLAPLPLLRQLLTQQLCLHLVGLLLGLPEQKISYQFLFSGSHTPPAHSAASRGVSWSAHSSSMRRGTLFSPILFPVVAPSSVPPLPRPRGSTTAMHGLSVATTLLVLILLWEVVQEEEKSFEKSRLPNCGSCNALPF